jgi:TIR domain
MYVSRVFISYRRDDTSVHADRIHARLQRHYGMASAFIDRVSIHPGEDFVSKVDETIRFCDAVLLLMGRGFTRIEVDRQRLDYVHIELRAVLIAGFVSSPSCWMGHVSGSAGLSQGPVEVAG